MRKGILFKFICLLLIGGMAGCQRESESDKLYQANCMNCHGIDGEGLKRLIPPLAGSDFLEENQDRLACIIRYGLHGQVIVNEVMYDYPMPGNEKLSAVDIANIINYINKNWSNEKRFVTPQGVDQQLQACKP